MDVHSSILHPSIARNDDHDTAPYSVASDDFNRLLQHLYSTCRAFGLITIVFVPGVQSFCCWFDRWQSFHLELERERVDCGV